MSLVKSLSVGNGDMFYIAHNSGSFTIIDCCINPEDESKIIKELKSKIPSDAITRFISTHPDDDHLRGLIALNKAMPIINFYCVENKTTKEDETPDFKEYCSLRDSTKAYYIYSGCKRKWLNESDEERKGSGINVIWPDIKNQYYKDALSIAESGASPNNISPIIQYSVVNGPKIMWMGDLETTFMENICDSIKAEKIDILFAPHHGRESGKIPERLLKKLDPKIIVIGEAQSKHLNYYNGYNTITQNTAGDITFECVTAEVHVFVSMPNYSVSFLNKKTCSNTHGTYIGSLAV